MTALRSSCAHCVDRAPVVAVRDERGRELHLCAEHSRVIRYAGRLAYIPSPGDLPEWRSRSIA